MIEADLVIFAYPIYWFHMPGQVKLFFDRTYMLYYRDTFAVRDYIKDKLENKLYIGLLTGGAMGIETALEPLKTLAQMTKRRFESLVLMGGGLDNYVIANDPEKMKQAYEFGQKIGEQL